MSKTAMESNTVFCVCVTSGGKLGPSRICQGIFYFVFFEGVIHSSTEIITPHKVGHPGAIYGQGITFFPCVRRPFASCFGSQTPVLCNHFWKTGLQLSVLVMPTMGDIYFIWGPASGRRCRSVSCTVKDKWTQPIGERAIASLILSKPCWGLFKAHTWRAPGASWLQASWCLWPAVSVYRGTVCFSAWLKLSTASPCLCSRNRL